MRKISNARITRHFNKYVLNGDENINPVIEITDKNSFKLFPFELTMGYITSTENGIKQDNNVNVYDYSTFSRVFTGLENVLAKWEGAYKIEKVNDNDNFLTKTYQVGRNIKGIITDEVLQAQFEASSISGDFLTEFTNETFDVQVDEDLDEIDLYKLYIIPQLKEEKWLYVSNAAKYYNQDKTLHHTVITLTTLNNKVAKTGRAIEEFVQRSAAGEGYAFPTFADDRTVTLDDLRSRDVPITSMQLEGSGAWAMGTMYAYGRPTIQKTENGQTVTTFNPKIEAPRLLLPYRMQTAIPSPVNTRPTAETDWLVGEFKPTLAEDFADWKEQLQSSYDLTQRAKYEGLLKSVSTDATVNATNPVNNGTRDKLLWNNEWKFKIDKTYNTETDALSKDTITISGDTTMTQLLCHNIFGLSAYSALPLNVEQNVSWNLRSFPLIGGFLKTATFGIPIGWTDTAAKVKMDGVVLAIPASLRDYANVLIKQSDELRIDLNTFTDEAAKNDAVEFSGIKATGSIWKTEFTDRFSIELNVNGETKRAIFNTISLGQENPISDDGQNIKITGILKWDSSCKPAPRTVAGYVIDTSVFKALAKMDYRQTFFSNNTQAWSGTYQTTSKFTTSIRDWTNATKFSDWNEVNNKTIDYPASINSPNPPTIQDPILTFSKDIPSLDLLEKTYGTASGDINNIDAGYANVRVKRNDNNNNIVEANFAVGDNPLPAKNEAEILVIDLSSYGGIQTILSDYDNFEITLNEKNRQYERGTQTFKNTRDASSKSYKIDMAEFVRTGETIITNTDLGSAGTLDALFRLTRGGELKSVRGSLKFTQIFKLNVDGDKIRVSQSATAETSYSFNTATANASNNAAANFFSYEPNGSDIEFIEFTSIKLIFNPKRIAVPT